MVTRRWGVPALLTTLTRRLGNGEDGVAFIFGGGQGGIEPPTRGFSAGPRRF